MREGLIDDQDYAQTREILMEDISRLEKQLAELKSSRAEYEEPLQEAKIWEALIEKYAHAEEISEELADAMIESMQMNGDNSLSIQFRYMDSFQAVLDTVKILRKEVA